MIHACYRGPITQDIRESEDRIERCVNLKPPVPYSHCFCFPFFSRAFSSKGTGTTVVCVVVLSIYTYTSHRTWKCFFPINSCDRPGGRFRRISERCSCGTGIETYRAYVSGVTLHQIRELEIWKGLRSQCAYSTYLT